jgi:hypothetical protein
VILNQCVTKNKIWCRWVDIKLRAALFYPLPLSPEEAALAGSILYILPPENETT